MKTFLLILGGLILSYTAQAQSQYSLNTESSEILVKGTSSLHDWESTAEAIQGSASLQFHEDGMFSSIIQLSLNVEVESIKSGKGIMDGKTHDALKGKKHPQILFQLGELSQMTSDSLFASGELTIAGKTQTINLASAYVIADDGSIEITGSQKLLMTDYGIKPPKAMLGTLKTGDEVEVVFNVIFQETNLNQ